MDIAKGIDESESGLSEFQGFADFMKVSGEFLVVVADGVAELKAGENILEEGLEWVGGDGAIFGMMVALQSREEFFLGVEARFVVPLLSRS